MASVSPHIKKPKQFNSKKGGHLILILGYDLDKKILYLHNPSGIYRESQEYAEVSFKDFKKFFDFKGIVICSLNCSPEYDTRR